MVEVYGPALPALAFRDTTLCAAQSLLISLPIASQLHYQWQDGSTSPTYTITRPGLYSVTASVGVCTISDTIEVGQEAVLQLPPDTTLCRGAVFSLMPLTPLLSGWQWSTGSSSVSLPISESGLYWVRSQSGVCPQADSIQVRVVDCPGLIPNVFTPNQDGVNDTFYIDGIERVPWRLEVYNRWGSQVYQSESYQNNWAGEQCPTGTYYYRLSSEALPQQFKGWVQVMR